MEEDDLVDYGDSGPSMPQEGAVVRGIFTGNKILDVPGYSSGRLIDDCDLQKGKPVYAKVVSLKPDQYLLDTRYVNQTTGADEDPDDEHRTVPPKQKTSDSFPKVNGVYWGKLERISRFGYFVSLRDMRSCEAGLLPMGKVKGHVGIGDEVCVKVVETIKRKFNCDMRYVDQKTGEDLDPKNSHSREKVTAAGHLFDEGVDRHRPSRSRETRRREEIVIPRKRDEQPVISRDKYRNDGDMIKRDKYRESNDVIKRRKEDVIIRRRPVVVEDKAFRREESLSDSDASPGMIKRSRRIIK
jgi:predicted RNA-binding protein with RPS1 domain